MIDPKFKTPYMLEQERKFREMQIEYQNMEQEEQWAFENFCRKIIEEKIEYDEFNTLSSKYTLNENLKWYILGKVCATRIIVERINLTDFLYWYRSYAHTNLTLSYFGFLNEKLKVEENRNTYYLNIKTLNDYINKTIFDYIFEPEKEFFKKKVIDWQNNIDILKVFDSRSRMHDRFMSDHSLYFILLPLLNIDIEKAVSYLSKVNNVFSIEEFLNIIELDIDLICNILKYSPLTVNQKGAWDNKALIIPLLTNTFNDHLLAKSSKLSQLDYSSEDINKELQESINKFIDELLMREDYYFITRKWLLYLTSKLESGIDTQQEITELIIESIAKQIATKDKFFQENFLKDEQNKNDNKNLLLALIYISKKIDSPDEYLSVLEKYILGQTNSIFIYKNNKNSFMKTEYYLLSRLFLEIENPVEYWGKIWQKLYIERKSAMYSRNSDKHYEIYHSQYFILIGIASTEYLLSTNKELALKFIDKIWDALMEIYLTMPSFLYMDFLINIINRIIILKHMMGGNIKDQINKIKSNPEMISTIILNLKNNNIDIGFIKNDSQILYNMKYFIDLESAKDDKYKTKSGNDFFTELETIVIEHLN